VISQPQSGKAYHLDHAPTLRRSMAWALCARSSDIVLLRIVEEEGWVA
jgi:hypothetical protein